MIFSTVYLNNRNLNNMRFEKVFFPRVDSMSPTRVFLPPTLASATSRVAVVVLEAAVVVGPTATVGHRCSAWIASVTFVLLPFPPGCTENMHVHVQHSPVGEINIKVIAPLPQFHAAPTTSLAIM